MTQAEVRRMFIMAYPGVRRMGKKGYWYRCARCGRWCGRAGKEHANIPEDIRMEVDHIRPWIDGGTDDLWNLQPMCHRCNRHKSSNPGFRDSIKIMGNSITHPLDTIASQGRKALRHSGLQKRK